jgi:hypothetical protein
LDTLVDAFVILKNNENLKKARLRVAGGKSGNDETFINRIRKKLTSCGFIDDIQFLPAFDRDTKLAFFQSLSLLSVPEKRPIAYGLYVLEALQAVAYCLSQIVLQPLPKRCSLCCLTLTTHGNWENRAKNRFFKNSM